MTQHPQQEKCRTPAPAASEIKTRFDLKEYGERIRKDERNKTLDDAKKHLESQYMFFDKERWEQIWQSLRTTAPAAPTEKWICKEGYTPKLKFRCGQTRDIKEADCSKCRYGIAVTTITNPGFFVRSSRSINCSDCDSGSCAEVCQKWIEQHDSTIRNQTLDEIIYWMYDNPICVFGTHYYPKKLAEKLESLRTPNAQAQQHERSDQR